MGILPLSRAGAEREHVDRRRPLIVKGDSALLQSEEGKIRVAYNATPNPVGGPPDLTLLKFALVKSSLGTSMTILQSPRTGQHDPSNPTAASSNQSLLSVAIALIRISTAPGWAGVMSMPDD